MLHRIDFTPKSNSAVRVLPRATSKDSTGSSMKLFTVVYRVESGAVSISDSPSSFKTISSGDNGVVGQYAGKLRVGGGSSNIGGDIEAIPHSHIVTPITETATVYYALVPLGGAADTTLRSRDEAASQMNPSAAPLSPEKEVELLESQRQEQHDYYRKTRKLLFETMDVRLGLLPEELQARYDMNQEEWSARIGAVELDEAQSAESLFRSDVEALERAAFKKLQEKRQTNVLLPWCTLSCSYCCMTRLEWYRHMDQQYQLLTETLLAQCDKSHEDLIQSEDLAVKALLLEKNCIERAEALRVQQLVTFEEQELAARASLESLADTSIGDLCRRSEELKKNHLATIEASLLRDKHLQVLRVKDTIELSERRLHRMLSIQLLEEERAARNQLKHMEDLRVKELLFTSNKAVSEIEAAVWKAEMSSVLNERDELAAYKEGKLAQEEADKREAERAAQADLEAEFKELKKLKKAGPPKNPPNPPCPRCNQPPIKDLYTHRIGECPERPAQCPRCETIMAFSKMEDHKAVCPSRIVQCSHCLNNYKASYLETVHHTKCDQLLVAKKTFEGGSLVPKLPFNFVQTGSVDFVLPADAPNSIKVTASSLDQSTASGMRTVTPPPAAADEVELPIGGGQVVDFTGGVLSHLKVSSVIKRALHPGHSTAILRLLDKTPIEKDTDISSVVNGLRIGTSVNVALMTWPPLAEFENQQQNTEQEDLNKEGGVATSSELSSPSGGGELSPVAKPKIVQTTMVVGTTIPLDQYQSMQLLLQTDEAQQCKPVPVKGGGKKGKK